VPHRLFYIHLLLLYFSLSFVISSLVGFRAGRISGVGLGEELRCLGFDLRVVCGTRSQRAEITGFMGRALWVFTGLYVLVWISFGLSDIRKINDTG
jgi:hypothetical protein